MYKGISNRVAVVTGGATGMGRITSIELAKAGAKVVVTTGHNITGAEDTVKIIRENGGEAIFVKCDVSDEDQVKNMVKVAVEKYGSLDLAFNNAGVGPDGVRFPFGFLTELSVENFEKIVNTNFKGVFLCIKHELIQMKKQGNGVIVNTASVGALKMAPGFGVYGPSKAAVVALTKIAAIENAAAGIRVNVVCPGPTVDTDLMKNTFYTNPNEEKILTTGIIPMARLAKSEEVAKGVLWLFSDEASFITGQVLSIDGGMSAM